MQSESKPIYLDFNATTPIAEEVATAMMPFLLGTHGNPSSEHPFGIDAKKALEAARSHVARAIGARHEEVIFTSGGTESNNIAIRGAATAQRRRGNHIITSSIEHPAVTEVFDWLATQGFRTTILPVDENGLVSLSELESACNSGTILVSIMHGNNEIGTLQPIQEISEIAHACGALMHTDAAQTLGKVAVNVDELGIDLLSIVGHKFYGPKGVGALYIRQGVEIERVSYGAAHERGLRPGTENTLLVVGLGKACEIASRDLSKNTAHLANMRDLFEKELLDALPPEFVQINARGADRIPNTCSASFKGVEANVLLAEINNRVAASGGAACHAGAVDMSPVLVAIGLSEEWGMGTVRFSTGRETTEEEIKSAAATVVTAVLRLAKTTETAPLPQQPGTERIALTRFTQGLGCACKIEPGMLQNILSGFPQSTDERVLIDNRTSDDAGVFKISADTALVQTVDFLTPIVDDPYTFGAIAATNALSDVYAMGGTPITALNIACFPSTRLDGSVLREILHGAADKCAEAGVSVLGGHTIEDSEPKFGLAVTGTIRPDQIWSNAGATAGDVLMLTKPIGTGILATACKKGFISTEDYAEAVTSMQRLNVMPRAILNSGWINACTDITGFGLLGHLREMLVASKMDAELEAGAVPLFGGVLDLAERGIAPGGSEKNLAFVADSCSFEDNVSNAMRLVLADAQTSGGLLLSVSADVADEAYACLLQEVSRDVAIIGRTDGSGTGKIRIISGTTTK